MLTKQVIIISHIVNVWNTTADIYYLVYENTLRSL